MKRTALRRTPLRPRSKAAAREYVARRAFVAALLAERPACEAGLPGCALRSVDVHEYLARGRGGAITPGPKADAQGQRFFALCRSCHSYISDNTAEGRRLGLVA